MAAATGLHILRRRARFVLLALASTGLAASLNDCSGDGEGPKPCLGVGGKPFDAPSEAAGGTAGQTD